jgi:hypothetical protein
MKWILLTLLVLFLISNQVLWASEESLYFGRFGQVAVYRNTK